MVVAAGVDVLVVDDDGDLRESIAEILLLRGYRVRSCANGKEALAAIRQAPPALLLLDLMMPVLDGWGVLERVEAEAQLARDRIVVMTAADGDVPRGVRILPKPFAVKQLLALVQEAGLIPLVPAAVALAARAVTR
jgi:CheY-like chemotaxis protein